MVSNKISFLLACRYSCRAAAKLLSALVHSYPDQLADIYSKAAGELVARFREREENVKADVFAAYCDLLRQVRLGI
jgi:cullin-associated NEDD8-dissociated protein 1